MGVNAPGHREVGRIALGPRPGGKDSQGDGEDPDWEDSDDPGPGATTHRSPLGRLHSPGVIRVERDPTNRQPAGGSQSREAPERRLDVSEYRGQPRASKV